MKQVSILIVVLATAFLAGCPVKPSGVAYNSAPKPVLSESQGALFIIHNGSAAGTSKIGFEINGQEVVSLADGEYTWIELPPGTYEVTNRTPFMSIDLSGRNPSSSTHNVDIKAGQKIYYNFAYSLRSMESGMGVSMAGGVPIAYSEPIGYYQRNFYPVKYENESSLSWVLYNPSKKYEVKPNK